MLDTFLKIAIKYLLKLPNMRIIDGGISKLLDYIKEGVIKTRYGYSIHFRVTSLRWTSYQYKCGIILLSLSNPKQALRRSRWAKVH